MQSFASSVMYSCLPSVIGFSFSWLVSVKTAFNKERVDVQHRLLGGKWGMT